LAVPCNTVYRITDPLAPPSKSNVLTTAKAAADPKAGETPAPQQLAKAQEHIRLAAQQYAENDYMGDVARVHAKTFAATSTAP
jgi:hypothetical protein